MGSRRLTLDVSDGTRLEAELGVPEEGSGPPSCLAVLAHPHPLYGGSMDAGLIDELFRLLPARGIGALRFNFRGVGGSTGRHDEGRAERLDVAAAVDAAVAEAGDDVAVFLCGWSFGADMSLTVRDARHHGWVCVAPPLRLVAADDMVAPSDPRPKLLLVPEHDQFRPPASAAEATAGWTATTLVTVAGADHFMWGHGRAAADRIAAFAEDLAG